jgi:two-component system chemotaxis sensor kinase CheA
MDDLLSEFLTETNESMAQLDNDIVRLEQNPNDTGLLGNIFRIMHTIKGTCGFLGLPRLESLAHAAENVLGKFRDGERDVTPHAVSLILESLDQIKFILAVLEESGAEPEGDDNALKAALNDLAFGEGGGDGHSSGHGDGHSAPATTPVKEVPFAATEEAATAVEPEPPSPAPAPSQAVAQSAPPAAMQKALAAVEAAEKSESADTGKKAATAPAHDDAKKDGGVSAQSIRVNVNLLEDLMNMVSELVLTRNQLLQISRKNDTQSEFSVPLQRLSQVTSELQEGVMKTRMQPIGTAWNKLPRIIRDLSVELKKKIDLIMVGEETELDRQVLEMIRDPLTHMVRNSADHGVEIPAERIKAGKPETGTVRLESYHEGGHIIIKISDDGRGINLDKVKEKAVKNGLATAEELAQMTDSQICQFIFKAGFSTAEAVTAVSGRGVGMDVVRTNIEKIGGTIELNSRFGYGSTFLIKIPLTLAIVSALIVDVAGERFAIPQLSVVELVRVNSKSEHNVEYINGAPVLRLRERLLPLLSLKKVLALDTPDKDGEPESLFIVVTQVGTNTFGMIVDRVYDTEEIVVKPVAPILRDISVFAGNTILGDGSVIMILDPNGIANKIGNLESDNSNPQTSNSKHDLNAEERISLLIFKACGEKTPRAVPLALVARLEEIELNTVEHSSGQAMVQYRGALMPLIAIDEGYTLPEEGLKPVLVFSEGDKAMGIIVDEIIDIVDEAIKINVAADGPGQMGSAIIRGAATEVIDAHYYVNRTFSDWFKANSAPDVMIGKRRHRKVLLVDDSAFFRNLLQPVLTVGGYEVTALENPSFAFELMERDTIFDIIVSDIEMPNINGFEFAQKVKEGSRWKDIPMVALSSHNDAELIARARDAGFIDYVPKFDRDLLITTLDQILNRTTIYSDA